MANVTPGDSRYIALITYRTYRRDGRPVTTPVWSAPLDGKLYVVTTRSTGKARRAWSVAFRRHCADAVTS
jgi:hypothetical protein